MILIYNTLFLIILYIYIIIFKIVFFLKKSENNLDVI